MRIALTFLAVFLVAALTTALVGPYLVDWSAQRGFFQSELARRLGAEVAITGPIEVRFLPTPYVTLEKVAVRQASGAEPIFACEALRAEFGLGGLFEGELRLSEVRLKKPVLRMSSLAQAFEAFGRLHANDVVRSVSVDHLLVDDGRLSMSREDGAPLTLSGLTLDAAAKSLMGPFRASGSASVDGGAPSHFEGITADVAGGAMPVKALVELGASGARATFDGKISLASGGAPNLVFLGDATVSGKLAELEPKGGAWPWKISARARGDGKLVKLESVAMAMGPEARAVEATGAAEVHWGAAPSFAANLQSKQLNLDSLLRAEGVDSASPARMEAVLEKLLSRAPLASAWSTWRLDFATPSIFLGAQTVEQFAFSATRKGAQPVEARAAADLPGQSHLDLSGSWELGAAPAFKGKLIGKIGDFRGFGDWLARDQESLAPRIKAFAEALPSGTAVFSGDVEASPVGFSARELRLSLDRSTFAGAAAYTRPQGTEHARLFLDLRSDNLDLDAAPNLEAAGEWLGDLDLSLALQATKLRLARVGGTSVEGGRLDLKASKSGPLLSLDRLSVSNLGGASLEGQAQSSPAGRSVRVRVDAARLGDFAALVARVAPGPFSRMLVEQAELLSPAKASFEARRDGPPLDGAFPLDFVKSEGDFGPSHLTMKISRAPSPVDAMAADVLVESSDGAAMLRQFGLKIPRGSSGRARVSATASGKWETGFEGQVAGSIAGADVNWRGRAQPSALGSEDPFAFGSVTVKSDNAMTLLGLLGVAPKGSTPTAPIDAAGEMVSRGSAIHFTRMGGAFAGTKFAADLTWRPPTPPVDVTAVDTDVAIARAVAGEAAPSAPSSISGDISVERASLAGLLSLTLGAPTPSKTAAKWSETNFGPPLLSPPSTEVSVRAPVLEFLDGSQGRNFSGKLRIDATKWELDDASADLGGGHVSGKVTLRRDGPNAALSGRLACEGVAVDRPGLHGKFGLALEFAGTGVSPTSVAGGLVGDGQVTLSGMSVARLDPAALSRVMAKAENPDMLIDETNLVHTLGLELDKQSLQTPDLTLGATIGSGVLRLGAVKLDAPSGQVATSAEFDIKTFGLDLRSVFTEAKGGKFWSGPPPSATVVVHSALDSPSRRIDASLLAAGLAAQAIARESDRIASLEADLRERAFFNRRLKADRFEARREAELAAFATEQARARGETLRAHVEAELQKVFDDRLKAEAAAAREPAPDADSSSPKEPAIPDAPARPKAVTADPTAGGLY